MGYTTEFNGEFIFNKPLTKLQKEYINKFSNTRRMKRDSAALTAWFKGKYGLVGNTENPYGQEGEFFIGGTGYMGQDTDPSVLDNNHPPIQQPSLWCQWITDGNSLYWNGGEKFYEYTDWLDYMIENFFIPWGIELNGLIEWSGEDFDDKGAIEIINNQRKIRKYVLQ
jgi:hypothetical protein